MTDSTTTQQTQTTKTNATSFTYAPYIAPVTGNRKLACVAIKWEDNPGASLSSMTNDCKATTANFKRLSGGKMNFTPSAFVIPVPYTHSPNNVGPAQIFVKKALVSKGIRNDGNTTYAIVNNYAGTGSHTNGNTSSILNTLTTTFYHEVGRSDPIHLGSSGGYLANGKYDYQGDGTSFMSRFSSSNITATQLYNLGWLKNTQVAFHADLTATADYPLQELFADDNVSLKAVLIPINTGKTLMLSRPPTKSGVLNALHQNCCPGGDGGVNRGSRKLAVFSEKLQSQGLSFQQISTNGKIETIRISPAPAATTPVTKPKK